MKTVDLFTLSCVPDNLVRKLENITNMKVKSVEIETIKKLLIHLKSFNEKFRTDGIIFDFKIEGIGEEFDILKNTKNFLLNIELKSNKSDKEIIQQLKRKKFYLSKCEKIIYQYSYNMQKDKLMFFDGDKLCDIDIGELFLRMNTPADYNSSIDELLSPVKYLASPFNDSDKFLNDDYLLTSSQLAKEENIMKTSKNIFLTGISGTGKTLLAYDIVKSLMNNEKKVLIIHGAKLNNGQQYLNKNGYHILPINKIDDVLNTPCDNYDLILIDEVQRFHKCQIDKILRKFNCKVILSGDPKQILSKNHREFGEDINSSEKLNDYCEQNNLKLVKLKEKIRTNSSLAEFVHGLLNKKYECDSGKINSENISFSYFNSFEDAKEYMDLLEENGKYKVLTLPTSLVEANKDCYEIFKCYDNGFNIIGQEFTNVATLLGPNIKYGENGRLYSCGTYYDSDCAFYQNITRARKNIKLVIVNNECLLSRIMDLLN